MRCSDPFEVECRAPVATTGMCGSCRKAWNRQEHERGLKLDQRLRDADRAGVQSITRHGAMRERRDQ